MITRSPWLRTTGQVTSWPLTYVSAAADNVRTPWTLSLSIQQCFSSIMKPSSWIVAGSDEQAMPPIQLAPGFKGKNSVPDSKGSCRRMLDCYPPHYLSSVASKMSPSEIMHSKTVKLFIKTWNQFQILIHWSYYYCIFLNSKLNGTKYLAFKSHHTFKQS